MTNVSDQMGSFGVLLDMNFNKGQMDGLYNRKMQESAAPCHFKI